MCQLATPLAAPLASGALRIVLSSAMEANLTSLTDCGLDPFALSLSVGVACSLLAKVHK